MRVCVQALLLTLKGELVMAAESRTYTKQISGMRLLRTEILNTHVRLNL